MQATTTKLVLFSYINMRFIIADCFSYYFLSASIGASLYAAMPCLCELLLVGLQRMLTSHAAVRSGVLQGTKYLGRIRDKGRR